jgi:vacuolar iron transporter family protein
MAHSGLTLSHLQHRSERHGQWTSGRARAAVFGLSDGLVSNLALVAGVAGATSTRSEVLVGGLAGLTAGSLSMAIGEYVSVRANAELLERELEAERQEIESDPAGETRELAGIYVDRGLDRAVAMTIATKMMEDPATALQAHAREELGIDPGELGSPVGAASASFAAFALGAAVPVLPWIVMSGTVGVLVSLLLGVATSAALGFGLAVLTRHSRLKGVARQVGLTMLAFGITFAIGSLLGTAV